MTDEAPEGRPILHHYIVFPPGSPHAEKFEQGKTYEFNQGLGEYEIIYREVTPQWNDDGSVWFNLTTAKMVLVEKVKR